MEAKAWRAAAEGPHFTSIEEVFAFIETQTCSLIAPQLCAFKLSPAERLVFGHLWMKVRCTPQTRPAVSTIDVAAAVRLDERTVRKAISKLQDVGLLTVKDRAHVMDIFVHDPANLVRGTFDDPDRLQRPLFDKEEELAAHPAQNGPQNPEVTAENAAHFAQDGPRSSSETFEGAAHLAQNGPQNYDEQGGRGPSCAKRAAPSDAEDISARARTRAPHAHDLHANAHEHESAQNGPRDGKTKRVRDLIAGREQAELARALCQRFNDPRCFFDVFDDLAKGCIEGVVDFDQLVQLFDDIQRRRRLPENSPGHVKKPGAILRCEAEKLWPGIVRLPPHKLKVYGGLPQ